MREKRQIPPQPSLPRSKPYFPVHSTHPAIFLLWGRLHSPLFPAISLNVLREVAAYYPKPAFLAKVYRHRLYIVDVHSLWTLSVPVKVAEHRLFWLGKGRILCAGDNLQCRHVYLVSFFPLNVAKLPATQQWSELRTYVYHAGHIYVFQDLCTDSEKLSLAAGQWSLIPGCRALERMPVFTVVWKETCLIEMGQGRLLQFDFSTETLRNCAIQTLMPWWCLAGEVEDGKVVVICPHCDVRIVNLAELTERSIGTSANGWYWPRSNGFTVITGNFIYWFEAKSREIRFLNLTTLQKGANRWVP